jgi:hypothetical protein
VSAEKNLFCNNYTILQDIYRQIPNKPGTNSEKDEMYRTLLESSRWMSLPVQDIAEQSTMVVSEFFCNATAKEFLLWNRDTKKSAVNLRFLLFNIFKVLLSKTLTFLFTFHFFIVKSSTTIV